MERLTKRGNGHAYYPRCFKEPCYGSGCKIKDCPFETAVCERLAAFEDIAELFGGIDRLRELAEADKDGRVVVLPCKDWMDIVFGGQTLFWGIDTDYIENPIQEISVDGAERIGWYVGWKTVFLKGTDENGETWEFSPDEIGKTVFLTREDAERAMEGRKDD